MPTVEKEREIEKGMEKGKYTHIARSSAIISINCVASVADSLKNVFC